MARSISMEPDAPVYRAVILKQYQDSEGNPEPFTSYEGPYATPGAAQGRVTVWVNYLMEYDDEGQPIGSRASGYVEVGHTAWSRMEDGPEL